MRVKNILNDKILMRIVEAYEQGEDSAAAKRFEFNASFLHKVKTVDGKNLLHEFMCVEDNELQKHSQGLDLKTLDVFKWLCSNHFSDLIFAQDDEGGNVIKFAIELKMHDFVEFFAENFPTDDTNFMQEYSELYDDMSNMNPDTGDLPDVNHDVSTLTQLIAE